MTKALLFVVAAALAVAACTSGDTGSIATSSSDASPVTTLPPTDGGSSSTSTEPTTTSTTTTTLPTPENECTPGPDASVEGYTTSCTVLTITLRAGEDVDPEALSAQADRVYHLLAERPDLTEAIVAAGLEGRIIPAGTRITSMPEFGDLYDQYPGFDWNRYGRSFPGTEDVPYFAGAEENLLCSSDDQYEGEDEFLRAFALTVRRFALATVDPATSQAIEQAFGQAIINGLWENTLAEINSDEYWVEGVQSFFDANLENNDEDREPNSSHNHVNTRDELRAYDPALWTIVASVFGESEWRPGCVG